LASDRLKPGLQPLNRLAYGDRHQDPPTIVAVMQAGKLALLDSLAEAVEGAEHNVFPIFNVAPPPNAEK
jgi:hypothetical protein